MAEEAAAEAPAAESNDSESGSEGDGDAGEAQEGESVAERPDSPDDTDEAAPATPTAASPSRAERRGRVAPLTIGLTGGIAAGKSEALAAFGRLGAATLSSDAVVHDLLEGEPLRGRLAERWGPEVAPEGAPTDRGRIGGIVFADPEQLTWLESTDPPAGRRRDRRLDRRAPRRHRGRRDRGAAALRGRPRDGLRHDRLDRRRRRRAPRARRRPRPRPGRRPRGAPADPGGEGRAGRPRRSSTMAPSRISRRPCPRCSRSCRDEHEGQAPHRTPLARGWPVWARRSPVVLGIVVGVLVASAAPFDKAINELTLPLEHEDIIRQQAQEKGVDAALIAAVIDTESKFTRRRIERRRPRPDADHPGSGRRTSRGTAARTSFNSTTSPIPKSTSVTGPSCSPNCSNATKATWPRRSPPTTPARATLDKWGGGELKVDDIPYPGNARLRRTGARTPEGVPGKVRFGAGLWAGG